LVESPKIIRLWRHEAATRRAQCQSYCTPSQLTRFAPGTCDQHRFCTDLVRGHAPIAAQRECGGTTMGDLTHALTFG
jgi:hypothetical protein